MNEKVLGYLTEYFQINDFFKKFYELVFTDKRLLIINTGETFRSWFARTDVAYSKRENLLEMDIMDIFKNFEEKKIESIYYKNIEEIVLSNKTFIKNGKIKIELCEGKKTYYTSKENSIGEIQKIFREYDVPITITVN